MSSCFYRRQMSATEACVRCNVEKPQQPEGILFDLWFKIYSTVDRRYVVCLPPDTGSTARSGTDISGVLRSTVYVVLRSTTGTNGKVLVVIVNRVATSRMYYRL